MTERSGADRYAERRELVEAGWEPKDTGGTVVWKNPATDYWYPQDMAIRLAREPGGNKAPRRPRGRR